MSDGPNLENERLTCSSCSTELDATDNFCRHCGAATTPDATGSPASGAVEIVEAHVVPEKIPFHERSRGFIVAMLFLILGPLAFPMLWRSQRFTTLQKVILTLVVTVLTIVVLWILWYVWIHWIIKPFQEIRDFMAATVATPISNPDKA